VSQGHFDPSVWNQYDVSKLREAIVQWCAVNSIATGQHWRGGGGKSPAQYFFLLKIVSWLLSWKGANRKIWVRMRERCVSILRFGCNQISLLILTWLLFKSKYPVTWPICVLSPSAMLLVKLHQCSEQWREIVPVNQPKSLELRKSRFFGLCSHTRVWEHHWTH